MAPMMIIYFGLFFSLGVAVLVVHSLNENRELRWLELIRKRRRRFDRLPPLHNNIFVQALAERIALDCPLETPTRATGGIASQVELAVQDKPETLNELKLFRLGHCAIAVFEDRSEFRVFREWVNEYYEGGSYDEQGIPDGDGEC